MDINSPPRIKKFEIALQLDTGNTVYAEFDNAEDLNDFVHLYTKNPDALRARITPRKITSPDLPTSPLKLDDDTL